MDLSQDNAQFIIDVCKRLYQRNMLAGADGNVSVRLDDGRIMITPSGRPKAFLQPNEMAFMDLSGVVLEGSVSSEYKMHLVVYREIANANVVIHAHPPTAVAWSVARPELSELPNDALSELILNVGRIPIIPFAMPGSVDMGEYVRPYLNDHRVMILARHGALSWGESFTEALNGMERIEHAAEILMKAELLGGIKSLSKSQMDALLALRAKLGKRST